MSRFKRPLNPTNFKTMKQSFIYKNVALAAMLAVTAGSAYAQSSVSIYGRLNETVERITRTPTGGSSQSVWELRNNSSRIGFRGTEDLGGGLKAGFQIEHGFNPDTGVAATTFWGRQSELNLGGGFGLVRLGNFTSEAYYATADWVSNHNHDTGTSSDAFYAYLGRNRNKIAYRLPSFAEGLSVEGAVSITEGAARPDTEKHYDFAVNYTVGGLQLGLGYESADNTTVDPAPLAVIDRSQVAVRAQYSAGPFTVGGYVQRDENAYGTGKRTNIRLSAMYAVDALEFHLNGGRAGKTGAIAESEANQFTVGVNYKLSKRTKVYGFVTQIKDGDAGLYGGDFRSVALGVRHNF